MAGSEHRFQQGGVRVLLVLLSTILTVFALPGGGHPLVILISLVPLGVALSTSRSRTECVLYAFGAAFVGWLVATAGLITGLSAYWQTPVAPCAFLIALACGWMALPYAAFGFLHWHWHGMHRHYPSFNRAASFTCLVCWFPTPLPINSSHALYAQPLLIQLLDFGGEPLLLFALAWFNWLIVVLCQQRFSYRPLACMLTVAALVIGYGHFRLWQLRVGDSASFCRIGIIQPNLTPGQDAAELLIRESRALLLRQSLLDVLAWPETPTRISCADETIVPGVRALAEEFQVPFLINCADKAPYGAMYNTELLFRPEGEVLRCRKQALLPFTEYLPGESWLPALRKIFPGPSRYIRGTGPIPLRIGADAAVIPATCYEILFPKLPRRSISRGGNILLSAANDGWFGQSRIPDFQVAACVFQAVQNRVPVVRVSNSGDSLAVKASGEITPGSRTHRFTQASEAIAIVIPPQQSRYTRSGDWFLYLLTTWICLRMLLDFRSGQFGRSVTIN